MQIEPKNALRDIASAVDFGCVGVRSTWLCESFFEKSFGTWNWTQRPKFGALGSQQPANTLPHSYGVSERYQRGGCNPQASVTLASRDLYLAHDDIFTYGDAPKFPKFMVMLTSRNSRVNSGSSAVEMWAPWPALTSLDLGDSLHQKPLSQTIHFPTQLPSFRAWEERTFSQGDLRVWATCRCAGREDYSSAPFALTNGGCKKLSWRLRFLTRWMILDCWRLLYQKDPRQVTSERLL